MADAVVPGALHRPQRWGRERHARRCAVTAGVSVGALYHHFAGKAALLEALCLKLIDDFQTGFVAELRSHSDAEEGVKSGVCFYLRWVARNRSGAAILFSAAPDAAALCDQNRRFFSDVLAWWRTHVHYGSLRDLQLQVIHALWLGPAHEYARSWLAGHARLTPPAVADVLAQAAWDSLRGPRLTFYDDLVAAGDRDAASLVGVEHRGDRAMVTLNDPHTRNVLSAAMVRQLRSALEPLAGDRAIRAIVLTGAGRGFCAGRRPADDGPGPRRTGGGGGHHRHMALDPLRVRRDRAADRRSDTAFIAALNGPAAGVGLASALTCDLAIASERAKIVPVFGRLGLLPEVGTSWALTRALGYQGAFACYAHGEHLDAQRALELGLVQEVVARDDLLAAADRWCDRIAALPAHAIAMTKPLLRAAADAPWENAIAMEEFAEPQCFTTDGFQESVRRLLRER